MTGGSEPCPYCLVNLSIIGSDGDGASHEFLATSEQRSALAARFGCVEISKFHVSVKISSLRKEGHFHVSGAVSAGVIQNCVVSLVPVVSEIKQELDLLLLPETEDETSEIESMSAEDDADFEFYSSNSVDIGEIGAVELALALDPYPRAPGVSVTDLGPGAKEKGYEVHDEEQPSRNRPFEVLAALKRKG